MSIRDFLLIIGMTIVAAFAIYLIVPDQSELNDKRKYLSELNAQNAELEKQLSDLQKENSELQNGNPYALMRAAREIYNYSLKGEKIYHFPSENKQSEEVK